MLATACSGLSSAKNSAENSNVVTLSYLLKESQRDLIHGPLGKFLASCGGIDDTNEWSRGALWRPDHQVWTYGTDWPTEITNITVTFDYHGMDPEVSNLTYGETKVLANTEDEEPGSAYLLDNSGYDNPLDFSRDEEVDLEQSRSTTTEKEIQVDIGTETKGSIDTGVGASFEQSVTTHLGIKLDTTTATSENTARKVTVHLSTQVSAGQSLLATVNRSTVRSVTPFTLNGVWIAGLTVDYRVHENTGCWGALISNRDIPEWDKRWNTYASITITWDSWDKFLEMCAGKSIYWVYAHDGMCGRETTADASRTIVMTGTQHRDYEDAAEVKFTNVTGQDLNGVIEDHDIDGDHVITNIGG